MTSDRTGDGWMDGIITLKPIRSWYYEIFRYDIISYHDLILVLLLPVFTSFTGRNYFTKQSLSEVIHPIFCL